MFIGALPDPNVSTVRTLLGAEGWMCQAGGSHFRYLSSHRSPDMLGI